MITLSPDISRKTYAKPLFGELSLLDRIAAHSLGSLHHLFIITSPATYSICIYQQHFLVSKLIYRLMQHEGYRSLILRGPFEASSV